MKIYPPITLFQEGQELRVSFYQLPEPLYNDYPFGNSGIKSYREDLKKWQASKTTLSVHNEKEFINDVYNAGLYKTVSQLEKGIDISSLLPRLEVKRITGFRSNGNGWAENQIVLKPEQPVNEVESQDELRNARIDTEKPEEAWIPISKRKPKNSDRVLAWVKEHKELGGQCLIAFYRTEKFEVLFRDVALVSEYVTHWMPLPSPPDI